MSRIPVLLVVSQFYERGCQDKYSPGDTAAGDAERVRQPAIVPVKQRCVIRRWEDSVAHYGTALSKTEKRTAANFGCRPQFYLSLEG